MGDLTESVKGINIGEIALFLRFVIALIGLLKKAYDFISIPGIQNKKEHERIEKMIADQTTDIKTMIDDLSLNIQKSKETSALMIRAKIKECYLKFMARGWVTTDELAMFKELLDEYWDLGHNHLSEQYLKDVERLTIKPYGHD